MKNVFISMVCLLNFVYSFAQQEIIYYVAPSVKDSLQKNLDIDNNIGCLWKMEGEFTHLIFFEIDIAILDSLTNNTSRYLYFDENKKIPIIFYSDFYFSSIFNKLDDGYVVGSDIILHGYYIKMNGLFMSGQVLTSFHEK